MGGGSFVHDLSDEPIDPSDCARWPSSPLCSGGGGIGLEYLVPAIVPEQIATDGCRVILTFRYQGGGIAGPNFSLGYKLPHCEPEDNNEKIKPPDEILEDFEDWEGQESWEDKKSTPAELPPGDPSDRLAIIRTEHRDYRFTSSFHLVVHPGWEYLARTLEPVFQHTSKASFSTSLSGFNLEDKYVQGYYSSDYDWVYESPTGYEYPRYLPAIPFSTLYLGNDIKRVISMQHKRKSRITYARFYDRSKYGVNHIIYNDSNSYAATVKKHYYTTDLENIYQENSSDGVRYGGINNIILLKGTREYLAQEFARRNLYSSSTLRRVSVEIRHQNWGSHYEGATFLVQKIDYTYHIYNISKPKPKPKPQPHPRGKDSMDKECCAAIMDAIAKLSEQTTTLEAKIDRQTKALELKIDEQTKIIEKQDQILQRLLKLLNFKEIKVPKQWEDPKATGQIAKTTYPELFGVLFGLLNRFREIVLPDGIWPFKVPKSLISPLGDPEKEEQLAHYPALIQAFWRWGDKAVGNPIRGIKIQNRNPQNGGPKYKETIYMSLSHMLQELLQLAADTNGDLDWTANAVLRVSHETVHAHREAAQAAEQCRAILDALGVSTGERHIEIASFFNLTEATKAALNEKKENVYEAILPTLLQEKKEKCKIVDFSGDANENIIGKLNTLQRYVDAISASSTTEWDGTGAGLAALAGGAGLLLALKSYLRKKDIAAVVSGEETLDDWIDEFENGFPRAPGKRGEHAQPGQPYGEPQANRPRIIEVDGK